MVFEFTQDGDVGYGWVWFLYVFINVYQVNHWVYHVYLTRPFKLSPPSHLELLRQFFIRQACIRAWKAWHESGSPNWMRSGDMDGHGWTSWCGSSVQALKKYLYSWLQRFFCCYTSTRSSSIPSCKTPRRFERTRKEQIFGKDFMQYESQTQFTKCHIDSPAVHSQLCPRSQISSLILHKASYVDESGGSVESLQHPDCQHQILLHRWYESVDLCRRFQPLGYHTPPAFFATRYRWNKRRPPQFRCPFLDVQHCRCVSRSPPTGMAPGKAARRNLVCETSRETIRFWWRVSIRFQFSLNGFGLNVNAFWGKIIKINKGISKWMKLDSKDSKYFKVLMTQVSLQHWKSLEFFQKQKKKTVHFHPLSSSAMFGQGTVDFHHWHRQERQPVRKTCLEGTATTVRHATEIKGMPERLSHCPCRIFTSLPVCTPWPYRESDDYKN